MEGSVDLFKMSSGSLLFDQRDSHHLGKRTRLVVVIINVSRETYRSLANNQEEALNFMLVWVSVERIMFFNTRKIKGPIVDTIERSNSQLSQALVGFPECLLLGLGNLFLLVNGHNKL